MSRICLVLAVAILLGTHFFYYPKWQKSGTEATISWDVSGYYFYLPATFIYKDLKQIQFKDDVLKKYGPTPELQQAFFHEPSGNYVMKYSIGQAVMMMPGFFLGHIWATLSSTYPPDGFSFPYQFTISMWVLFIMVLGMIFLRKVLLEYFGEIATGLTLIGIVLGSNYLNYAAIDGAMTHSTLFTVYTLLLYTTMRFYEKPTLFKSIGIGVLVGLAALTRPTEIIAALIPVLWGVDLLRKESTLERISFFLDKYLLIIVAGTVCAMVGSIQLIYWKYTSGEWIVYSYQDQGFSWLKPHLMDGMFSYKSGWLTYSPFMIFSLVGFYALYKKQRGLFYFSLIFSVLFIYIAFAWDIWWYGGSLGQRAMVQSYPVLAIPLCAFFCYLIDANRIMQALVGAIMILFIYANVWFTHQAHLGGILHVGQMRKAYFWKTLFTYEKDIENLKLLDDVNVVYTDRTYNNKVIYQDTSMKVTLNQGQQFSPEIIVEGDQLTGDYDWIRISAEFSISAKEWFYWTMTQFVVEVRNGSEKVSGHMIRVQRLMNDNQTKRLHIDLPEPKKPFTALVVKFWNADGNKEITIEDLRVETFDESED